jgi:monoamine oxidase
VGMATASVLIVGAGASGLLAGFELVSAGLPVTIIEARDRIGGRVHTVRTQEGGPIELGAEFIHGDLPLTGRLMKRFGNGKEEVAGSIWRREKEGLVRQQNFLPDTSLLENACQQLQADVSVTEFISRFLGPGAGAALCKSLLDYVAGYYAADPGRASARALCNELTTAEEKQYRPSGGYGPLLTALSDAFLNKGGTLYLNEPVQAISWEKGSVTVSTKTKTFTGSRLLLTLPLGVWRRNTVAISPALPQKADAFSKLGFGGVIKVVLLFKEAFWKNRQPELKDLNFLFTEEPVPTWWTKQPHSSPLLTGWAAGPYADKLSGKSTEELTDSALSSLARTFVLSNALLEELLEVAWVADWTTEPYTAGGYSYAVVQGEHYQAIAAAPVEDTLFFAGEGLVSGPLIGTVEAAFNSGQQAAQRVLQSLATK